MKKLILFGVLFALPVLAQVASPAPAVLVAPSLGPIGWTLSHEAIIAALAVAIIDLALALVPSLESNGILHMVYLWLKGMKSKPQA